MASYGYEVYVHEVREMMEELEYLNYPEEKVRDAILLLDEFNSFIDIECKKLSISSDSALSLKRANSVIALRLDERIRVRKNGSEG